MRYIVLSLLVVNFVYLGWSQAWHRQPSGAADPSSPPPGFPINTGLTLLSEYQAGADAGRRDEAGGFAAAAVSSRQPDACLLFGAFPSTEEAEDFLAEVRDAGAAGRITQPDFRLPSYYRVFIPPAPSLEAARETLNEIRAGISDAGMNIDTYLVRQGSQRNAISLGVFSQRPNALNVQAALESLGFQTETEEIPRFAGEIRVVVRPLDASLLPLAQWRLLTATRPYLTLTDDPC